MRLWPYAVSEKRLDFVLKFQDSNEIRPKITSCNVHSATRQKFKHYGLFFVIRHLPIPVHVTLSDAAEVSPVNKISQ